MIARGFAEHGAKVYISSRDAEACDQAAKQLGAFSEVIAMVAHHRVADSHDLSIGDEFLDLLILI